ncbi:uncharacterized protein LOC144354730 [Saccoglossus kowalevskii]
MYIHILEKERNLCRNEVDVYETNNPINKLDQHCRELRHSGMVTTIVQLPSMETQMNEMSVYIHEASAALKPLQSDGRDRPKLHTNRIQSENIPTGGLEMDSKHLAAHGDNTGTNFFTRDKSEWNNVVPQTPAHPGKHTDAYKEPIVKDSAEKRKLLFKTDSFTVEDNPGQLSIKTESLNEKTKSLNVETPCRNRVLK